jgi:hypothetical protein
MSTTLKAYVSGVIGAGAIVLVSAMLHWTSPHPRRFLLYLALAMLASLVKMRLPGIDGTYSISFIFILMGIVYLTLPETLVIGCAGALVQTTLNAKHRPTVVQVLFNMANLILSIGLCFLVVHGLSGRGLPDHQPAVLALVACVFFVTNTVLVSGVLTLLQGKPLKEVCQHWYLWSFPYYLIGAAVVGLLPLSDRPAEPTSWLILLPPLYLIHFYYGLLLQPHPEGSPEGAEAHVPGLPVSAKLYISAVITGGLMSVAWAAAHWDTQGMPRFVGYLFVALLASTCKVRLPRMTSTISLNFVLILVAIAQLPLSEVIVISGAAAVVQCLWKPQRPPAPVQVFFSLATLIVSATLSFVVCRLALAQALGDFLSPLLVLATGILYVSNVVMVAAVLCLVEGRPLYRIWQNCCFWSFPYYLVGAAFAGLMIITSRLAGWQTSFLVLPLMALVYVSYRLHVKKAVLCSPTS